MFLFDLRLIITEPQDESGFYQYKTDCILVRGGGARGARRAREWAVWWWEGQTLSSGAVWEQFVPLSHGPTCCCCRPTLCR